MMGRTHAASGALAWSALCTAAPALGQRPGWAAALTGLATTAGAALLPDLDHPDATIAHTFGPATRALAEGVHKLAGGHRRATHSLAFAAAAPLAAWVALLSAGRFAAVVLLFVLTAFGARAVRVRASMVPLAALAVTAAGWFALGPDVGWLPWSVAAGVLAHLAGDCLTREGCPLLWPRRRHYMLAVVRRTGNRVETWLFAPMFAVGAVALLAFAR